MEQLRTVLAWMAKHHFWLLSGLAVLISFTVWYLAAGDLTTRKEANLKTIQSAFQQQQTLSSTQPKPSPDVIKEQDAQIAALAAETERIWQELYDRQRQDVLQWPKQLPPAFLREVEKKEFGDEIGPLQADAYGDYIRGRFADLPKIINANEIDEQSTPGGYGGGRGGGGEFGGFGGFGRGGAGGGGIELDEQGNPIEPDYTVFWTPADQERIKAELDWPSRQSHWRIWVTQEDLWVYETVLRAIAATNKKKGATRQSNAAITTIGAVEVGRDAATQSRTTGRITRMQGAASALGGEGEMMMDGGRADPGAMDEFSGEGAFGGRGGGGFEGGEGGGQLDPAAEKARWLSRRYIDGEGLPITVSPDAEPLDPSTFGQEVKRLPVRLVVEMDTRWLATLISELANADLQIKVTEVRVGVDPASTGGGGGGGGEFGGRGGGGGRGGFGGGEFGGFGGGGYGGGEILVFDRKPYMKPVVIQGVVLIFNKPDESILKGDEAGASADSFAAN